jgi:hypothetical protein
LVGLLVLGACDDGSGDSGTTSGGSTSTAVTGNGGTTGNAGGTTPTSSDTSVTNTGGQNNTSTNSSATGGASGGTTSATGGTTGTTLSCSVVPINPNAIQPAKNLLCYLYGLHKKQVLSGQQETSWNWNSPGPSADVEWIKTQTGKYPAVLGGDYLYPGDTAKGAPGTTDRAKAWWQAGGITMIRYHMGAPPLEDSYENSKGSVANLDNVVKAGTTENNSFKAKLDYVAKELKILQDAGVPVLWAPFHEVQPNGWFWWSKGTGAQYIAIWKAAYDYLTHTKGLNNLLWLLPFSGNPNASYYPGKQYVDLAGPDTYDPGQPFSSMYTTTANVIKDSAMPIPLHETGTIPQPSQMFPSAAPWVLFSVWATYASDTQYNTVANIKSAYASNYTITRDEVPNLK